MGIAGATAGGTGTRIPGAGSGNLFGSIGVIPGGVDGNIGDGKIGGKFGKSGPLMPLTASSIEGLYQG